MITTTLVFDRRKVASKTKKGTVEIRIILNRKSYYISTGVRIYPNKWNEGFVVNTIDCDELNERLRVLMAVANKAANDAMREGKAINVKDIKDKVEATVSSAGVASRDMLDWMTKQVDSMTFAPGTMKHYFTTITRLNEYRGLMRWSDLTIENLYMWDSWLHKLPGTNSKYISDGGVYTYHKTLKALLARAERFGKIDYNPYNRLKGQFKRGDVARPEYLTEEEMDAIRALKLQTGSELGKARDLFVFQIYTGMAYVDTQKFDIKNYKKVKGRWKAVNSREKTGTDYVNVLLPPVVDVLERYGWNVPKLSNQAYNRVLKVVGEMAGINIKLHSHLARHTFATWMLRNGAKIENVSRMLGHTNIKQTQRYAKVLAESVYDDFEMAAEKLKK